MGESVGQTFRSEVLRDPNVSENEVPRKGDVVTPKVNYTFLEFYRTMFHNIVPWPKNDEYRHAVMDDYGNYVYEKINMERTVVNMDWEYNKSFVWESIRLNGLVICFLCIYIIKCQINLCYCFFCAIV